MEKDYNTQDLSTGRNFLSEEDYRRIMSSFRQKAKYRDLPDEAIRELIDQFISESEFADPLQDLVFDRVFGNDKQNLLTLLQVLLPDSGISEVERVHGRISSDGPDGKEGRYDIVCRTEDGRMVNIEAQKILRNQSPKRWIYYLCNLVKRQLDKAGAEYDQLRPSYCIVISNEGIGWKVPKEEDLIGMIQEGSLSDRNLSNLGMRARRSSKFADQVIMHFQLVDIYSMSLYAGEPLNIVFVNLDKMRKTPEELQSKRDELLYLLRNLRNLRNVATIPPVILRDFSRIVDSLQLRSMDRDVLDKYFVEMITDEEFAMILKEREEQFSQEIDDLEREHSKEIALREKEYSMELEERERQYSQEIDERNKQHSEELKELDKQHSEEMEELGKQHSQELKERDKLHSEELEERNKQHSHELEVLGKQHSEEMERERSKMLNLLSSCSSLEEARKTFGELFSR